MLAVGIGWRYCLTRQPGHSWGDDFAQYIQHACNLLAGGPYKATGHLLNPRFPIAPEVYPPLFPLLLAPVVAVVGPFDLAALKCVGIGCLVAFLIVWGRRLEADATAEGLAPVNWPYHLLPLLMVLATKPTVWGQKDDILSDLSFLLTIELALLAVTVWRRQTFAGLPTSAKALALGLLLWMPVSCRTVGLPLIGAFVVETLWVHRQRWAAMRYDALTLLTCGLLALIQRYWLDSHEAGYMAQLRQYFSLAQVRANANDYWQLACRLWGTTPHLTNFQYSFLGVVLLILIGRGWWRQWRRRPWQTAELFAVAYVGVVVLWPMPQGVRFLLPLLPPAVRYGWLGARALPGRWGRTLPTALAVVLVAAGVAHCRHLAHEPPTAYHDRLATPEDAQLFGWLRRQPAGRMCLFWKPRALYLFARQPAMAPVDPTDSAQTERDIAFCRARYWIAPRDTATYWLARGQVVWRSAHWQIHALEP